MSKTITAPISFKNNDEKSDSIRTASTMALEDEQSISEIGDFNPTDSNHDQEYLVPDDITDYGYEEASPDIAIRRKYSSIMTKPIRRVSTDSIVSSDSGMSEMSGISQNSAYSCPPEIVRRRSSMKQSGRSRRSSIQISGEIEVTLPGKDQPVRRRTSISFNETVKVKRVAPVHELTDAPNQLWFSEDEYDKIRRKSFKIVDKFVQGEKIAGKKLCTRGLESILNHENRTIAKENGWDSVLNEQHMQREDGHFDDEYLSKVYKFSTRRSSNEAIQRAEQDQADVEKYLQSTRRVIRRLTIS